MGVHSVAFGPAGGILAAGGYTDTIQLWSVRAHAQIAAWQGKSNSVRSVALSPDGCTLASAGNNGVVWLWKIADTADCHAGGR
jgi:WD40 repeat protein